MFCSRKMNRKINYTHERSLRLVYDNYFMPFELLLIRDNSVSIHHRNIQKVAIEMFKVKNRLSPDFIQNLFCETNSFTRSNAVFRRPNVNTAYYGERSVRNFGPNVCDTMVPENLKSFSNLDDFKRKVREWVPENYPCNLCKKYVRELGFVVLYE